MKISVINGTEKHGVTYRLKEIFLILILNIGKKTAGSAQSGPGNNEEENICN